MCVHVFKGGQDVNKTNVCRQRVPSRRCRHRKGPRGKVASNTGWSGKEICIGRTQESVWKIVRNEFRQAERLRGMKCFPHTATDNPATAERI